MLRWDFLTGDRLQKGRRRKRHRNVRSDRRLAAETLEDRRMLAVFVVDNTGDVGAGSLRQAIIDANNTANVGGVPDEIQFNIPGAGLQTIQPASALPAITDPVVIDGYTQPGSSVNTAAIDAPINATLLIEIDGQNTVGANGLEITAGNSTVRGLVINRFDDDGIEINTAGGNTIEGNFIGTDDTGETDLGNGDDGVFISATSNNTIGGTTAAARNLISGNNGDGIQINAAGATTNQVQGNFIGTDKDGDTDLGNSFQGVHISLAPENTVGGTTTSARNLISGNNAGGVLITGSTASMNTVSANYIGVDLAGTTDLGNSDDGVSINGAPNNTVGGTTAGTRNIISGNNGDGVIISGDDADGNTVSGNYIGTDETGTADVGNSGDGVEVSGGADTNTVGGTTAGAGNLISGNGEDGVEIADTGTTLNRVEGNLIGTNAAGTAAIANDDDGVEIENDATNNFVGGVDPAARNTISGNDEAGVRITGSGTAGSFVTGNYIGTNSSGTAAIANGGDGIVISSGANNTVVGGTNPAARNVISGNTDNGVLITGTDTNTNLVWGNYIGVDAAGTANLGNGQSGVLVADEAHDNSIGSVEFAETGNVIAFNDNNGVTVVDDDTINNEIGRNSIFNNDNLGIDLGDDGVTPNDFVPTPDADEGPNRLQNFPVFLGSATLLGNSIAFRYRVPTDTGNATYPLTVEFFVADSDNQEGQTYLASDTYTAAEAGLYKYVVVPAPPVLTNNAFVATATDADGNTSEFSAPVQIELPTILGSEPTIILRDEFINIDQVNRYQYIAHSTGKTVVRIDFLHLFGDLDLEVRDQYGNLLAMGNTSSADQNFEEVILPMVTQETYFIYVTAVDFNDDIGQTYALEVENFPAPVPSGVHLDPNSDSGMMNNDGVTNDTTPTFFIQTDVLNFVDTNNDGVYSDPDFVGPPLFPYDAIHVLTAAEAEAIVDGNPDETDEDGGIAVEVSLVNTTTSQLFTYFADPLIAIYPDVYQLTVPEELPDGVYLISARTKVFDGQGDENGDPDQAMARSNASPPLWITIDTYGPLAESDLFLVSHSDSGMYDDDRVTNKMQPAFTGFTEPNAKVKIFAQRVVDDPDDNDYGEPTGFNELVGTGVADSSGEWEVTVEPLIDGKYNITAQFEDAAGNFSDPQGITAFETNDTAMAIPDNGTVNSFIQISTTDFPEVVGDAPMINQIVDVNVLLTINHPNVEDLDVVLISPIGTQIDLTSDNGGDGDNYTDTTFDDSAGVDIDNAALAAAPFTGRFRPEQPLSDLQGETPFGQWTLRVTDDAGNDLTGQLESWSLEIHIPLMVVIDTVAPNTPFLGLVNYATDVIANNMPTVSMTTTDPNIALAQLLWQDNLKFRIYDRFDNTAEFLLYDSALDPAVDAVNVFGDMFTALTLIEEMLPEQYFNLFGTNDAVINVNGVGKLADGMHNLKLEVEDRAGNISEDFLLKITIDTSPLLGTWAAGEIVVGSSSNSFATWAPGPHGETYLIGTDNDYIFAGQFLVEYFEIDGGAVVPVAVGYDTLAAYGRIYENGAFVYRWLVDLNGNGYIDPAFEIFEEPAGQGFIGVPVAGNFDGNATNGDEVGLFTGTQWYLDTDHDFNVTDETPINANYAGFPIAGDFDGNGIEDLATYTATSTGGNLFYVDTNQDGNANFSFHVGSSFSAGIGFSGTRERPVSADFNADGYDDFGLWVPDGINPVPNELSEWYLLLSGDDPSTAAVEFSVLDRILDGPFNGYVPFAPYANDIYAQYGNTFALPVVGRFLPSEFLSEVVDGADAEAVALQVQDVPLPEQVLALVQSESEPFANPVVQQDADVIEDPKTVEVNSDVPAKTDTDDTPAVETDTKPSSADQSTEADTVVDPEVTVQPEIVETTDSTPVENDPVEKTPPAVETVVNVESVTTNDTVETSVAELPVAPIEQPTLTKSFRRSRYSRFSRAGAAAPDQPAGDETTTAASTPTVEVIPPVETVNVETETVEQPQSLPAEVKPAVEPVVIVIPEVVLPTKTTPVEQVDTNALETAFAEVTNVELSGPGQEPDDDLAAEQAEVWQAVPEPEVIVTKFFRRSRWVR